MTGLHNDDENNVLCQIYGKTFLYPPETRAFLYVNGNYDSGTECYDVDVVDSAAEQYPNFSRAKPFEINCSRRLVICCTYQNFGITRLFQTKIVSISVNHFVSSPPGCTPWCQASLLRFSPFLLVLQKGRMCMLQVRSDTARLHS